MASASGYNHHRFTRSLLKKTRKWEASLTIELYPSHWRFQNAAINFQYTGSPMSPFLLALRSQVIPASLIPFLYDIRPAISFYDGCLVVELHDFRKSPETKSRVVMRPAAEALAQTIDVMLERKGLGRDEELALELESRIIAATSPPLYLGTSILASRNAALAIALTNPAAPNLSAQGTYRNPNTTGAGDEKSESEVLRKMMHAGERTGGFQPTWSVLRAKEMAEAQKALNEQRGQEAAAAAAMQQQQAMQGMQQGQGPGAGAGGSAAGQGGPGGQNGQAGQGAQAETKPKKPKKKRAAPPAEEGEKDGAEKEKPAPKKKKKPTAAAATAAAGTAGAAGEKEGGEKKKTGGKKKAAAAAAAAAEAKAE